MTLLPIHLGVGPPQLKVQHQVLKGHAGIDAIFRRLEQTLTADNVHSPSEPLDSHNANLPSR